MKHHLKQGFPEKGQKQNKHLPNPIAFPLPGCKSKEKGYKKEKGKRDEPVHLCEMYGGEKGSVRN